MPLAAPRRGRETLLWSSASAMTALRVGTPRHRGPDRYGEILVCGARHLAMVPRDLPSGLLGSKPLADSLAAIAGRRGKR